MNDDELRNKISTIFKKEMNNLKNQKSFFYVFIKHQPKDKKERAFLMNLEDHVIHEVYSKQIGINNVYNMMWRTYDILTKLYIKIQDDKNLKKAFISELERFLQRDTVILSQWCGTQKFYDYSSLAFYFLAKNKMIEEACESIINSVTYQKNLFYLLSDINDFIFYETYCLDDESLRKVQEIMEIFGNDETRIKFSNTYTEIKYADLEEELIGISQQIDDDRKEIIQKIRKFGFPSDLEQFLDDVEEAKKLTDLRAVDSGMINGLRNFFNDLFTHMANRVKEITKDENIPHIKNRTKIADTREYIKNKLNLSDKENDFLNTYIDLLHKHGGHKMLSERKYLDLTENIGIEIAYFLLSELEKFEINMAVTNTT